MELPQYEGLPPFQHFAHDGNSGSASVLTYDASLSPAITTVSSLAIRLDDQVRAEEGLCKVLGRFSGDPQLVMQNSNGDRFFRTDQTALAISQRFDAIGSDFVQSSQTESSLCQPQRFDRMLAFDDIKQARLVFFEHQRQFVSMQANANRQSVAVDFHCFQPIVKHFSKDLSVFIYLPIGRHSIAYFVVKEKYSGYSKVLSLTIALTPMSFLNHWCFFIKKLDCVQDEDDEDDDFTIFNTVTFYMTNLCQTKDGSLEFFHAEDTFSLPRQIHCVCAECFAETSMSQLCGGYFCHTSSGFDHLGPEAYKIAIDRERRRHEMEHEKAKDYHFLGSTSVSTMQLFQTPPKTLSSSMVRCIFSDSYTVRVNEHLFEVKVDYGKVINVYERSIKTAAGAKAFSPLLDANGSFFYVRKDNMLVFQDDTFARDAKLYGRVIPKDAENIKLFHPMDQVIYCYWTVGKKHFMSNLETFMTYSILPREMKEGGEVVEDAALRA